MLTQTLIVYLSLALIFIFSCNKAKKYNNWKITLFPIIIYAIIMGVRYKVGIDYSAYLSMYLAYYGDERIEPGFQLLLSTLRDFNFHYSVFFGTVAFLQIYFIYRAIKQYPDLYSFLAFTFMFGCVWYDYANGLRQELAFCIFVFSLKFILEKKWLRHYLLIALAFTMHKSAIVLSILYPLFQLKKDWFTNVKIQLLLLVGALFLMQINVIQSAVQHLEGAITLLGYDNYLEGRSEEKITTDVELGIGFFVILCINIILIANSNKVKKYFNRTWLSYAYNLYFIGVLWQYIFITSQLFNRINYYLYGFQYIIAAFTLAYLWNTKRKLQFSLLVCLYLLLFTGYISSIETSSIGYIFYWQYDLHYLKSNF